MHSFIICFYFVKKCFYTLTWIYKFFDKRACLSPDFHRLVEFISLMEEFHYEFTACFRRSITLIWTLCKSWPYQCVHPWKPLLLLGHNGACRFIFVMYTEYRGSLPWCLRVVSNFLKRNSTSTRPLMSLNFTAIMCSTKTMFALHAYQISISELVMKYLGQVAPSWICAHTKLIFVCIFPIIFLALICIA